MLKTVSSSQCCKYCYLLIATSSIYCTSVCPGISHMLIGFFVGGYSFSFLLLTVKDRGCRILLNYFYYKQIVICEYGLYKYTNKLFEIPGQIIFSFFPVLYFKYCDHM